MTIALKDFIHAVPDFPKPGILFRDISPLLGHPEAFSSAVSCMEEKLHALRPSVVVAIESRGFVFGAPAAMQAGLPLVLVRKPGKLPGNKERIEYQLEYGIDALEIKSGMIQPGARVAIIDDVLATGGTAYATAELVRKIGGVVAGFVFLAELVALGGRGRLPGESVSSLVQF